MKEAVEILKSRGYSLPADKKGDIDPGGEREIAAYVKEKYGHDFVFLTDWPISVRPFYHMRIPEDQSLTRSFDLIANGLEITTGAQREHRIEVLQKQALEKGLHLEPIQFYLDFFRYGCPSHGGFGLGLSRLMMVILEYEQHPGSGLYLQRSNTVEPVEDRKERFAVILGENVRLRAMEREDIPRFVRWMNDPEVTEFLLINSPLSKAMEEQWFERQAARPPHEGQVLGIEVLENGNWVHIGNTGLHNVEPVHLAAEFGIVIGEKEYWNKGFGREATRLMLKHGFENLNLKPDLPLCV